MALNPPPNSGPWADALWHISRQHAVQNRVIYGSLASRRRRCIHVSPVQDGHLPANFDRNDPAIIPDHNPWLPGWATNPGCDCADGVTENTLGVLWRQDFRSQDTSESVISTRLRRRPYIWGPIARHQTTLANADMRLVSKSWRLQADMENQAQRDAGSGIYPEMLQTRIPAVPTDDHHVVGALGRPVAHPVRYDDIMLLLFSKWYLHDTPPPGNTTDVAYEADALASLKSVCFDVDDWDTLEVDDYYQQLTKRHVKTGDFEIREQLTREEMLDSAFGWLTIARLKKVLSVDQQYFDDLDRAERDYGHEPVRMEALRRALTATRRAEENFALNWAPKKDKSSLPAGFDADTDMTSAMHLLVNYLRGLTDLWLLSSFNLPGRITATPQPGEDYFENRPRIRHWEHYVHLDRHLGHPGAKTDMDRELEPSQLRYLSMYLGSTDVFSGTDGSNVCPVCRYAHPEPPRVIESLSNFCYVEIRSCSDFIDYPTVRYNQWNMMGRGDRDPRAMGMYPRGKFFAVEDTRPHPEPIVNNYPPLDRHSPTRRDVDFVELSEEDNLARRSRAVAIKDSILNDWPTNGTTGSRPPPRVGFLMLFPKHLINQARKEFPGPFRYAPPKPYVPENYAIVAPTWAMQGSHADKLRYMFRAVPVLNSREAQKNYGYMGMAPLGNKIQLRVAPSLVVSGDPLWRNAKDIAKNIT